MHIDHGNRAKKSMSTGHCFQALYMCDADMRVGYADLHVCCVSMHMVLQIDADKQLLQNAGPACKHLVSMVHRSNGELSVRGTRLQRQ